MGAKIVTSHNKMPAQKPQRRRPITYATAAGAVSLILPVATLVRLYARTGVLLPSVYITVMSGVTFLLYGYDKMQARNLQWRMKETTLHTFALLGGWPGALIGQHFFQHKTRKTKFQVPFWAIVSLWQIGLLASWKGG